MEVKLLFCLVTGLLKRFSWMKCLFLHLQWVCLQFVIVVFPDHTHLLY